MLLDAQFAISDRHRKMFLENLDVIGLTLRQKKGIVAVAEQHWQKHPWVKSVASQTRRRLSARENLQAVLPI